MKKLNNIKKIFNTVLLLVFGCIFFTSCEKYLDIPLPVDTIAGEGAFISDNSASGVVSGSFSAMYNGILGNGSVITGVRSAGYLTGLYSDELQNIATSNATNASFYKNLILPGDLTTWTELYKEIYNINVAIEGIRGSKGALLNKNQWLGESLVIRAQAYFHLVNLFGDVPLATTPDFGTNNASARSPKADAYALMVKDLLEAQQLLSVDYKDGFSVTTTDRGRPNRFAATALLAKVYLYQNDWQNAEIQSTAVINNPNYQLTPLASTFLTASKETIWAVGVPTGNLGSNEYKVYNNGMPASTPVPGNFVPSAMSNSLIAAFESGDQRLANWTRITTVPAKPANGTIPATPAISYYFPSKYKAPAVPYEYAVVLRLAEQYLIRAEARTNLNNLDGAKNDINAIRGRAGLTNTPAATKDALFDAVLKERRVELFTEGGHRFFDLKRSGKIDAVMAIESPLKGSTWKPQMALWPIPVNDTRVNPNLTQTPGY